MGKFNKENAKKESKFFYKKYLDETIWTQTILEGENLTFVSVQSYFDPLLPPRTQLNKIFSKEENVSKYTLSLLDCLKNGWNYIDKKLSQNIESLNLDDLIILNYTLSKCDGNLGGLRQKQVRISGTYYLPPTPIDADEINKSINNILNSNDSDLNKGLELFLFGCKTQIFDDGNKRTSLLNASFYLINNGVASQFYLPKEEIKHFRQHLINYYENENYKETIKNFLKKYCITYTNEFKLTDEYKEIFNIYENEEIEDELKINEESNHQQNSGQKR